MNSRSAGQSAERTSREKEGRNHGGYGHHRKGAWRRRPRGRGAFRSRRWPQRLVAGSAAAADRRGAQFRGRRANLRRGAGRQPQGVQRRFRSEGRRRPFAGFHGSWHIAPAPEARPAADARLAGHGTDHHRRHGGLLRRRRRGAGGCARFPHHEPRRPYPGAGNRPRHEHELAERAAHAGVDGTGQNQAGGHPGGRPDQRHGGL